MWTYVNTPLDNILNVRLFATFFRQFHVKFLKRAFYFRSLVTNIKSFLLVCKSKRNIYLVPSRYARKLLHEAVSVILFPNFMECNFIGKTSCFTWWQPFFKRRKKCVCCSKGLLFFKSIVFWVQTNESVSGDKGKICVFLRSNLTCKQCPPMMSRTQPEPQEHDFGLVGKLQKQWGWKGPRVREKLTWHDWLRWKYNYNNNKFKSDFALTCKLLAWATQSIWLRSFTSSCIRRSKYYEWMKRKKTQFFLNFKNQWVLFWYFFSEKNATLNA